MMRGFAAVLVLISSLVGCDAADKPEQPAPAPPKDAPKPAEVKRTPFNKNGTLFLETMPDGRKRVVLHSEVCLREGSLELLLCRKQTKEHEAILHADVDARDIHTVLLLTKAVPGSPVKYQPKYEPPTGTTIKITLEYQKKGETVTVDAKEWIRSMKTQKALAVDWVFAGSRFFQDPDDKTKPPYYMANNGDVICVSNFVDALLDLPIDSSKENADLAFEAWADRIPEKGTKVLVIFEPVLPKK